MHHKRDNDNKTNHIFSGIQSRLMCFPLSRKTRIYFLSNDLWLSNSGILLISLFIDLLGNIFGFFFNFQVKLIIKQHIIRYMSFVRFSFFTMVLTVILLIYVCISLLYISGSLSITDCYPILCSSQTIRISGIQ